MLFPPTGEKNRDGILQLSGSPFVIIKMFATVCQSMSLVAGLSKVTTSTGMKSKMIFHCTGRMGKVVNLLSKLSSNWSICEYASVHGAAIFNLMMRFRNRSYNTSYVKLSKSDASCSLCQPAKSDPGLRPLRGKVKNNDIGSWTGRPYPLTPQRKISVNGVIFALLPIILCLTWRSWQCTIQVEQNINLEKHGWCK